MRNKLMSIISRLTEQNQRLLACDYAERALMRERALRREPDPRSWNAIYVAREYAMGRATSESLSDAASSAYDAIPLYPIAYSRRSRDTMDAAASAYYAATNYRLDSSRYAAQAAELTTSFESAHGQIARAKEYLEAQETAKTNLLSVLLQRKNILKSAVSSWQRDTEEMFFI